MDVVSIFEAETLIVRVSVKGRWDFPAIVKEASFERQPDNLLPGIKVLDNAKSVSIESSIWNLALSGKFGLVAASFKRGGGNTYLTLRFVRGAEDELPLARFDKLLSRTFMFVDVFRNPDHSVAVVARVGTHNKAKRTLNLKDEATYSEAELVAH